MCMILILKEWVLMLFDEFKDKVIIVTGHTGFKGSWLSTWLSLIGARVVGISNKIPTKPSRYDYLKAHLFKDIREDIRSSEKINNLINSFQPDYVFHLAAQSLVKRSYSNPKLTWETNLMGSINVLEGLKKLNKECISILITSDKCYKNREWVWGYREEDTLGGIDPYSASKAATELAINSYVKSFFSNSKVSIATARAGNVIGGGDWSENRLIPDCVRAWSENKKVKLRSPSSTRPWQHVLEPLSGYLTLALNLKENRNLHGQSFNFGPFHDKNSTVLDVVEEISNSWKDIKFEIESESNKFFHECNLLKLNCDKALQYLKWKPCLSFEETIEFTSRWYKKYYENVNQISELTEKQILNYERLFVQRNSFKP